MLECTVIVKNRAGLHTRPAAMLVKLSAKYSAEIYLERDGMNINAKSIIGVMTLAAEQGAVLILRISGNDELAAQKEIVEFFHNGFGEL